MVIQIQLSKKVLALGFRFAETGRFFERFQTDLPGELNTAICLSGGDWETLKTNLFEISPYTEYTYFPAPISDALLPYDRCVIHAAAVRYRDRAWLLAGPSGVGKSTQIRSLQSLEPGAFGVICGDRPVLELRSDGSVMVWPSPWNGKENWYGAEAAPLAGIILIQRGEESKVELLSPRDAVVPVYAQLIQTGESLETMQLAARFEDRLLQSVPTHRLTASDIPTSGQALYAHLQSAP